MNDKRHYILAHDTDRKLAAAFCMLAPAGWHVRITPPTRSLEQNAMLHKLLTEISKQCEFAGKKRTAEQWKLIMVSGHAVATKQQAEILPGLEGEFINLRESTASMSVKRLSSLIEYVSAWCAQNGVIFDDTQRA